ncbi:CaiB/BaiF CoA-transferase family protein [Mycolicibacterium elephantis]|uniref:Caib/baif family protein n=1 Tax=Mycolicibacterium elephantis DSM 44368 TaxID=1335622 RepID=A0A439DNZ5_9MYCO|nr:CoA transferase [Mycolicibacterium elephantis]MCV7219333.1 CoA transferase [Mycolicibacterium elephantis]RWA17017.1 caib/baif family protein [Mycolicibacterium elephantis DSM 44368]
MAKNEEVVRVGDIAPTPLGDLRVVEISDRIAGAYCGKMLVDAGADVIKVEPLEGDPFRRHTVTGALPPVGTDSPLFSYLNAGKRSVTRLSDDLLSHADIVVLTANRGDAASRGIDPQRLLQAAPRCVVVTVSDFGWTGPWAQRPATEFTLQAASGLTGFRGDPAGPPIAIGGELGEYMGGVWAAYGTLALHRRVRTGGPGGHLDMSMLEAVTLMQSSEWLHSQLLRVPPVGRSVEVPSIEQAQDGFVGISMVTGQQWLDFAAMVECPEFTEIPALQFQIGRWDYRDWIRERIGPWMRSRTVEEIVELGQLFRLPLAPLGNGATIPAMDHMAQRGVYVDHPAGFRQPRPPWLMTQAAPAPVRAAPTVGNADDEPPWPPRASAGTTATSVDRPLAGVRIVDFTAFWAGPAATHALAAFGADVIKVESVQRPDGIRYSGGMREDVEDWWEYGWVFHAMNTNKRSVTLDLQSEEGVRLVKELVRNADAVVENFSPRVMDQFGLGADVLLDVNPRLVMMRMPAFGLTGPWRDRVGFAPTMEQIAGLAWVTGLPDGPPVAPRGACDPLAGAHAAFALLAALDFAERTGRGQLVEVPMIETVLNVTAAQTMEYEVFARIMERRGNRGHTAAVQDIYRCAGDDSWVAVCAHTEAQRAALAELSGGSEAGLEQWLASQDAEAAAETLVRKGIPAAVVVSPSLVVDNPQLRHRGFFEKLEHPRTGAGLYPCPPFARPDGVDAWLYRTPPTLGEHNAEVLTDLCGLEQSDLDRLSTDGVIGTRPKGL